MRDFDDWQQIDWLKVNKDYRRLVRRINKAWRSGDQGQARRLVNLAFGSNSTALLAVRAVTEQNRGGVTPGDDGECRLLKPQKLAMALGLNRMETAKPYRRTQQPKRDGSMRNLDIPCMNTRAQMVLLKLSMQAIVDQRLHPHLIGARSGSGIFQALQQVVRYLADGPRFVAVGDIKNFYPSVSWDLAIEALGLPRRYAKLVEGWLSAPTIVDGCVEVPTKGVQQGSPIAPILAHLTLEGLHKHVLWGVPADRWPLLMIYVDDILVLAHSSDDAARALTLTGEWLSKRGYQLHPQKTSLLDGPGIVSTKAGEPGGIIGGFTYLGVRIAQYPVDPMADYMYEAYRDGYLTAGTSGASRPPNQPSELVTVLDAEDGSAEFVAYSKRQRKRKGLDKGALRRFTRGLAHVRTETDMA